jgi:hypothetical protein
MTGISSVGPTFPLHLWDRLLPQAEITLNLLRTSRLHPQLSAAAHFHGLVDYNKTSLAPPGCKIISHEKPGNMDILWAQKCITTAVKMSTSRLQLVNASWTHSSFSLTIIRCHSYLPLTDFSWRPTPCQMHYKTLIWAYHSLTSWMTPSQRSQHWRKFSNSNSKKFTFPNFQLHLPRSLNAHASPNHPNSRMPPPRQTISQTKIHAQNITNVPLLPMVVTPMMSQHSPPRVSRRSQNIAPRDLSQYNFCGMDTAHMAIALGNQHWSQHHHANAVVHPITGKEME